MFEFTKRARKILEVMAYAEARRLGSESLAPEHVFLALFNDDESVASRILKNLGVNFDSLKEEIDLSEKKSGVLLPPVKIPIDSRFTKIIEISRDEARKLKNSYIGTEHLLLAIFREGSCAGLAGLLRSGIDYGLIRTEISRVLGAKDLDDRTGKLRQKPRQNLLEEYTGDLTALASAGKLDPVIGRDSEINRLVRILSRKRKNNPILIGEAGVGKTAIVEGLALRINENSVPEPLRGSRVLVLDMASIVAGTKYRGEFEERLKKIVQEIKSREKLIIFIDEIHTIIGAGAAEGAIDAANILKPVLARGELQCIGATTVDEYRMYIEKDAALERRFQEIFVSEPDREETLDILRGLKVKYEEHHRVVYSDEALVKTVSLAERYISERFFPDKAIDILDEAGALARMRSSEKPQDISAIEDEITRLNDEKNALVASQEYEKAAALRDLLIAKKELHENKISDWNRRSNEYTVFVNSSDILSVVMESTGIPVESLEDEEIRRLLDLEETLRKTIIGQNEAIESVCRTIRRSRMGIGRRKRPAGTFMFLGPSGVGKTELAKKLSAVIFGSEKEIVRLDMSEYMEKHSVSRMIGAPPGYVGYEDGGQLTEKIKRRPYSIILLDEIEKAHPDVLNILLQIFEEGELSDSSGDTVSFRDTVIIMTSNAGSRDAAAAGRLGFLKQETAAGNRSGRMKEFNRIFSPEFINRIDEIIYFNTLGKAELEEIVVLLLNELQESLQENSSIEFSYSPAVRDYLFEKGVRPDSGARDLRRTVQREIEDSLAYELMKRGVASSVKIKAAVRNGGIVFTVASADKNESRSPALKDAQSAKKA